MHLGVPYAVNWRKGPHMTLVHLSWDARERGGGCQLLSSCSVQMHVVIGYTSWVCAITFYRWRLKLTALVTCSVTKSCLILCDPLDCSMTDSCLPLSPMVCSNSFPKSIEKELVVLSNHLILCCPLLLLPLIFPGIRVFPNESTRIGASALLPPMNSRAWFPLGLSGLISLLSRRLSRVLSSTTVWKYQVFGAQLSLWSNSHPFSVVVTIKSH